MQMYQADDDMHPLIILHYIITHNLTSSRATVNRTVFGTAINISLDEVPPGHYYIDVAAVNIVGKGEINIHSVIGKKNV